MNSKMMIVEATSESRRRTVVIVEIPFAKLTIYLEQKNINNGFLLGNAPIGPSDRQRGRCRQAAQRGLDRTLLDP
jgi:hypothetical protein